MTDPQQPSDAPVVLPATAAIQELVANPARLGLIWQLRVATVTIAKPGVIGSISIRYDEDDSSIGATSMVGAVSMGDRVYVITVPPSGNFIVGFVNNPRGIVAWARRTTNFTVSTSEAGCLRIDGIQTFPGHAYRISTSSMNWSPGGTNQAIEGRLRYSLTSAATTGSTQFGTGGDEATTSFAPRQAVTVVGDLIPSGPKMSVLLSFVIIGGTGTGTILGSSIQPISLYVEDMGSIASIGVSL